MGRVSFIAEWLVDLQMLIFPGLKTLAALDRPEMAKRWAMYWVGASLIYFVLYLLRAYAPDSDSLSITEALCATALTYQNGWLVRKFTRRFILPLYRKHKGQLTSIISNTLGLFRSLLWNSFAKVFHSE